MPNKTPKKKRSTIGRKTSTDDGLVWDSELEAECYLRLRASGLKYDLHPEFPILPSFQVGHKKFRAMRYTADFRIYAQDTEVIVEVKSPRTRAIRDYPLRRKLVAYFHQIVPVEITSPDEMYQLCRDLSFS